MGGDKTSSGLTPSSNVGLGGGSMGGNANFGGSSAPVNFGGQKLDLSAGGNQLTATNLGSGKSVSGGTPSNTDYKKIMALGLKSFKPSKIEPTQFTGMGYSVNPTDSPNAPTSQAGMDTMVQNDQSLQRFIEWQKQNGY